MGLIAALPVVGQVLDKIFGVVDKAVADKDLAVKLKSEIQSRAMEIDFQQFEKEIEDRANARALALEESKTDVWLARFLRGTFRPTVGYAFVGTYMAIKITILVLVVQHATTIEEIINGSKLVWGIEDFAVMGGILGFYYGLRTREKRDSSS